MIKSAVIITALFLTLIASLSFAEEYNGYGTFSIKEGDSINFPDGFEMAVNKMEFWPAEGDVRANAPPAKINGNFFSVNINNNILCTPNDIAFIETGEMHQRCGLKIKLNSLTEVKPDGTTCGEKTSETKTIPVGAMESFDDIKIKVAGVLDASSVNPSVDTANLQIIFDNLYGEKYFKIAQDGTIYTVTFIGASSDTQAMVRVETDSATVSKTLRKDNGETVNGIYIYIQDVSDISSVDSREDMASIRIDLKIMHGGDKADIDVNEKSYSSYFVAASSSKDAVIKVESGDACQSTKYASIEVSPANVYKKQTLSVKKGWNLIAANLIFEKTGDGNIWSNIRPEWKIRQPSIGIGPNTETLVSGALIVENTCSQFKPWHYSPQLRGHFEVKGIDGKILPVAAEAFPMSTWLYSDKECSVTYIGTPIEKKDFDHDSKRQLYNGWNMISTPITEETTISIELVNQLKLGCNIVSGPWEWNANKQKFVKADVLKGNRGYFVKVNGGCVLGKDTSLIPKLPGAE